MTVYYLHKVPNTFDDYFIGDSEDNLYYCFKLARDGVNILELNYDRSYEEYVNQFTMMGYPCEKLEEFSTISKLRQYLHSLLVLEELNK